VYDEVTSGVQKYLLPKGMVLSARAMATGASGVVSSMASPALFAAQAVADGAPASVGPFAEHTWVQVGASGAVAVRIGGLTAAQETALQAGTLLAPDGALYAQSEATPYVTLNATGTAFSGPCELAGWYCSVAAGTITIYDATSATGTPIVPATALAVGPMPIFGAGTNGRLVLQNGCHVVLSGAATVRVAVG
jgi:hypothetical protein